MPTLTRIRSSTLNERNRMKSLATHFLTNVTELKVPLQKVTVVNQPGIEGKGRRWCPLLLYRYLVGLIV